MKLAKVFASLMFVLVLCSAFTMEKQGKGMYIIGVSASFTDSLIYFTDVQFMEGVQLGKNGLLPNRDAFSKQLDDYLEQQQGMKNRTCFIYFDKKKAKLEKSIKKMKDKYQKEGKSMLREVGPGFKFSKDEENQ